MPDSSDPGSIGAAAHERFVVECKQIDRAHHDGRLDEWLEEKLANERRAAGFDDATNA